MLFKCVIKMSKEVQNLGTNKKISKETITPHKICVTILIRQYCLYRESPNWNNPEPNRFRTMVPGKMSAYQRRDFCIVILRLVQSPDLNLKQLRGLMLSGEYNIAGEIIKKFDQSLRDLRTVGVSNLLDIIDYLSRLTADQQSGMWCQINKNSILGLYLRRLMVSFHKLSFSQIVNIFEAFKEYYKPCEDEIKIRRKILPDVSHTNKPRLEQISLFSNSNHWSKRQAELFLATQTELLTHNPKAADSPKELREKINCLLKDNPDLAEAHFLNYLNYMRVSEFCGALDSLYATFDKNTPGLEGRTTSNEEVPKMKGFRYAALNLAILYYEFGYKEQAIEALKESINKAQEASDHICLQHALTWLYQFDSEGKEYLMQHSMVKSKSLNLNHISSMSLQSYAQYVASKGFAPKFVLEMLLSSDLLNNQSGFKDLTCMSYSLKGSLWYMFGKMDMANLLSQLTMFLNLDSFGKAHNGEGMCQGLCRIADILSQNGYFTVALKMLSLAEEQFGGTPFAKDFCISQCRVQYLQAMNNHDWESADEATEMLASFDVLEAALQKGQICIFKSDLDMAQECVNYVMAKCDNSVDDFPKKYDDDKDTEVKNYPVLKAKALMLQADIYFFGNPQSALPVINLGILLSNVHNLAYYSSWMKVYSAHLNLRMGLPEEALAILDHVIYDVLANCNRYDIARFKVMYAKCLVACATSKSVQNLHQVVLEAVSLLEEAKDSFFFVEAWGRLKDVLYLQAQLYNEIDLIEERNNCSVQFLEFDEDHPTINKKALITSV